MKPTNVETLWGVIMKPSRIVVPVLLIAACATATRSADLERKPPAKPTIRVVASYELAGNKSVAYDLRWAGPSSVYLTSSLEHVSEHRLAAGLPVVRELFPSPRVFDPGMVYVNLAVSAETMVVSAISRKIAWRPIGPGKNGQVDFERQQLGHAEDMDLQGDRLAWVGLSKEYFNGPNADNSGLAWVDSLSDHLDSPQRLMTDVASGRAGTRLMTCTGFRIGGVRFQPDGSLLVAPGFVDEAALFDSGGYKLRSWDLRLFGVDFAAACANFTEAERQVLFGNLKLYGDWINRWTVIDDALATPAGPALVIRTMKRGLPTWRLHLLGAEKVTSFDLPLRAETPYDRLTGDVRGNQLAVLLYDGTHFPRASATPDRVVLLELPGAMSLGGH